MRFGYARALTSPVHPHCSVCVIGLRNRLKQERCTPHTGCARIKCEGGLCEDDRPNVHGENERVRAHSAMRARREGRAPGEGERTKNESVFFGNGPLNLKTDRFLLNTAVSLENSRYF